MNSDSEYILRTSVIQLNDCRGFCTFVMINQDIHLLSVDLLCAKMYNNDNVEEEFMDIVKVFGANLKRYRIQKGLSQERFAEKCGLHRTYISDIECFRRSISLENVQRIADALEIKTYQLFIDHNESEDQV